MPTDSTTVRLLGGFSIRVGEHELSSLPPQAVSLLAYLVVHRSRPQTRDLLAGRFWSELSEDRARKRLSNCLWQIKRGLTEADLPDLLDVTSTSIQFAAPGRVEVDAEEFESKLIDYERELRSRQVRGVLTDRLADLVSSYPGDFLAGHYHEWIEPERSRIRERYHNALAQLIGLYKSRSQYEVALEFAHILVEQEPLREDLHREVMRLHALLDQAPAAERQFETCRRELQNELGVEPSEETIALLQRIRSDAPAPAVSYQAESAQGGALVGRRHEMGVLLGRVDELLSGQGGAILVEGDPGIGKTRLIREFMEAADWRGVRVVHAGHTELSRMEHYSALIDVLEPAVAGLRGEHLAEVVEPVWLQKAAEVLPGISRLIEGMEPSQPLRPNEEPTRMSEALSRVVLAQGGLGPTVIVLEDVHWSDDDSMQVLVQLGGRLARSGVLLCLSYRRFEAEQARSVWTGIERLEAYPFASRLVLGPLNGAEVRELVTGQLGPGVLPEAMLNQVVAATNGNPLYALESARDPSSILGGAADDEDEVVSLLPAAVARSLDSRISALDPEERAVLEVLAAVAEPASATLVAEITGIARVRAVEALARTTDLGFVTDDEHGRCSFAHDQTRRMVYERMAAHRRLSVHAGVYRSLEALDDQPMARLAHHARLADDMAATRRWHLGAAREALAVNAYRTAADHFGQADDAAQELGLDLATRAGDLLVYETTLDVLGRRTEQAMLLKSLRELDLALPIELELAEREAWLQVNNDEPDEAANGAGRAVERAKAAGLPYVGLLNVIALARYRAGDLDATLEAVDEALASAVDDTDRIGAETTRGKALVDLLRQDEGKVHLLRAAEAAEAIGDARGRIEAVNYLAVAEFRLGNFDVAESYFAEALGLSESIGYRWGEGANLTNLAALHTAQGHGGQALDLFSRANDILGSLDYGRAEAIVKLNLSELNHRLLGDDEEAASLASSSAVYFRSVGDEQAECQTMAILSSIDRRHGRRRLARRRLNGLLATATVGGDVSGEVDVRRILAALDADGGDRRAAMKHLDAVVTLGEQYPLDSVLPNVLANRARLAFDSGDRALAETSVERALEQNRAGFEVAHVTAWLCATVLDDLGRSVEAANQFRLAYELQEVSLQGLPADMADRSRQAIPEHTRIDQEYERHFEKTTRITLPRVGSPIGRPLRADEQVDVTWTVSEPDDWSCETAAERRRRRLARLIEQADAQGGATRISDLAGALSVSERTIKRDLADLRAAGADLRTRRSN